MSKRTTQTKVKEILIDATAWQPPYGMSTRHGTKEELIKQFVEYYLPVAIERAEREGSASLQIWFERPSKSQIRRRAIQS